jgi:hypothetical protein
MKNFFACFNQLGVTSQKRKEEDAEGFLMGRDKGKREYECDVDERMSG